MGKVAQRKAKKELQRPEVRKLKSGMERAKYVKEHIGKKPKLDREQKKLIKENENTYKSFARRGEAYYHSDPVEALQAINSRIMSPEGEKGAKIVMDKLKDKRGEMKTGWQASKEKMADVDTVFEMLNGKLDGNHTSESLSNEL